jgi:hypothetical protein
VSQVRRGALLVLLCLLGCRGTRPEPASKVTVQTLEVSFDSETRGRLQLELAVSDGGGLATAAQWQLLLDGRPLGSGVQLLSQRLAEGRSTVSLSVPLLLPHSARDEGWRNITLEISGELTVKYALEERFAFSLRRQALVHGAPRP